MSERQQTRGAREYRKNNYGEYSPVGKRSTDGQITLDKTLGHLKTIGVHKLQVMRECFAIGLYYQGIMHDLSKFMPSEFLNGCKYTRTGREAPTMRRERTRAILLPGCTIKAATATTLSSGQTIPSTRSRGRIRWCR